jgi:hypothetical protein
MARQSASERAGGSTATKNAPGNQTPDTPEVNESEIARLKVDQLRDRLRRRGITGTADMRKPELVDALIRALREGRPTTRSTNSRGSGSRRSRSDSQATAGRAGTGGRTDDLADVERAGTGGRTDDLAEVERQAAELADAPPERPEVEQVERRAAELEDAGNGRRPTPEPAKPAPDAPEVEEVERRAAELEDVPPERPEVEEVERRAAELAETPADRFGSPDGPADVPALPPGGQPESGGEQPALPAGDAGTGSDGRAPRPRSAGDTTDRQPVRAAADASRSGPSRTMETADRVVTSMVPPEVGEVDQVVTPEGTMVTAPAAESVATPPLPGAAER